MFNVLPMEIWREFLLLLSPQMPFPPEQCQLCSTPRYGVPRYVCRWTGRKTGSLAFENYSLRGQADVNLSIQCNFTKWLPPRTLPQRLSARSHCLLGQSPPNSRRVLVMNSTIIWRDIAVNSGNSEVVYDRMWQGYNIHWADRCILSSPPCAPT